MFLNEHHQAMAQAWLWGDNYWEETLVTWTQTPKQMVEIIGSVFN